MRGTYHRMTPGPSSLALGSSQRVMGIGARGSAGVCECCYMCSHMRVISCAVTLCVGS